MKECGVLEDWFGKRLPCGMPAEYETKYPFAKYLCKDHADLALIAGLNPKPIKPHEEDPMKSYIGAKIIQAEPMDECTFLKTVKGEDVTNRETREGYKVVYPDGYVSWSPRETFEIAYREITDGEKELV